MISNVVRRHQAGSRVGSKEDRVRLRSIIEKAKGSDASATGRKRAFDSLPEDLKETVGWNQFKRMWAGVST